MLPAKAVCCRYSRGELDFTTRIKLGTDIIVRLIFYLIMPEKKKKKILALNKLDIQNST